MKNINNKFVKFVFSSLSSSIIDFLIYSILIKTVFKPEKLAFGILLSTVIARIFSSLYNYIYNKKRVFKSKGDNKQSLFKFFVLTITQMLLSSLLVSIIYYKTSIESIIIKCFVDTMLFFTSYIVQKIWIFN